MCEHLSGYSTFDVGEWRLSRRCSVAHLKKKTMRAPLSKSAHMLASMGLCAQYPQASGAENRRRLTGFLLGEKAARNV